MSFIVKKESFTTRYLAKQTTDSGIMYYMTEEENLANIYNSEKEAKLDMQRSGYNGIQGLKIVEIV